MSDSESASSPNDRTGDDVSTSFTRSSVQLCSQNQMFSDDEPDVSTSPNLPSGKAPAGGGKGKAPKGTAGKGRGGADLAQLLKSRKERAAVIAQVCEVFMVS